MEVVEISEVNNFLFSKVSISSSYLLWFRIHFALEFYLECTPAALNFLFYFMDKQHFTKWKHWFPVFLSLKHQRDSSLKHESFFTNYSPFQTIIFYFHFGNGKEKNVSTIFVHTTEVDAVKNNIWTLIQQICNTKPIVHPRINNYVLFFGACTMKTMSVLEFVYIVLSN